MPRQDLPRAVELVAGGVVTRADLVAGDVSPLLGDRQVRLGAWTRLAPSTYLACADDPTDAQLVAAARQHVGADAVVTGAVVCRARGLRDVPDERVVEVLVPAGRRVTSTPYVVAHQTRHLPPTWVHGGARYADVPRAVVDAGRRVAGLRPVRALLLGAVCDGHADIASLSCFVEAGGSAGSAVLRRALADATAGAWSAPEAEAADLVRAAAATRRLPGFVLNAQLVIGGRLIGRPDGYLTGTGVGWQVDSRRHHSSDRDFDATLAVHDEFAAAGVTLLHVTPRRLRALGPGWVALRLAAVAASRGEPRTLEIRPHDATAA